MALTDDSAPDAPGTGRGTRARIGLQVGVTLLLALAVTLLVDWLGERPGLRWRADWTAGGENTLAAPTREVLERLPVEVDIDVFFKGRALEGNLQALGFEAQEHALRLVRLLADAAPDKLRFEEHDLSDRTARQSRPLARMGELGLREIEPGGVVVVSAGPRNQVLRLRGGLSDIDPGAPGNSFMAPIPPRLVGLRAEEALVSALHKVATDSAPRVLFTKGHGELDPESSDYGGAAALRELLHSDGFQTARWDLEQQGPLPLDTNIVVVLGPEQPFSLREFQELRAFLDGGGRLIAAPDFKTAVESEHSLPALLASLGIEVSMQGLVARPVAQSSGGTLTGIPDCSSSLMVFPEGLAAMNPVTEPLRKAGRRVVVPFARALSPLASRPPGAAVLPILRTDDLAWLDLGTVDSCDWTPKAGEPQQVFVLGMQAVFPAPGPIPPERLPPGARAEARVLCVGSSAAFSNQLVGENRDFLLNAFNWASAREHRVSVEIKSPQARRLEVQEAGVMSTVQAVCVYALPLLCLALGLFTAWRRRR